MTVMPQLPLGEEDFARHRTLKTCKRVFFDQMEQVIPWLDLVALIAPHASSRRHGKAGRPPFAVETMLRIHLLQQWFNLSDPAMEEALHDMPAFRHFAGLDLSRDAMPDETTILRFRHLLEKHDIGAQMLAMVNARLSERGLLFKAGTLVDATIIAAPSSTKNKIGERDPEMHSIKKGNQYHFGMKAHIGVDAESGLVHTVVGTAANSGASVSHHQASVRSCQGALSRFGQEHCTTVHTVCAVQSLDGARAVIARQRMSALRNRPTGRFLQENGEITTEKWRFLTRNSFRLNEIRLPL